MKKKKKPCTQNQTGRPKRLNNEKKKKPCMQNQTGRPNKLNNEKTILLLFTCIATGKSLEASGGKNTSTAFFGKGWFPAAGVPTSII